MAPVLAGEDGVDTGNPENAEEGKEESDWPDLLVVTGLEDCDSPLQTKLIELVKLSARERPDKQGMMLVWIRPEQACDRAPPWLVCLNSSDL